MPGGASKTLEITFSVDFIVEEGTNRILWVDSNPYTYPTWGPSIRSAQSRLGIRIATVSRAHAPSIIASRHGTGRRSVSGKTRR